MPGLAAVLLGAMVVSSAAFAQSALRLAQSVPPTQQTPVQSTARPAPIDRNGVLTLIRSILLALDHANKTGNYTVLRDLGAPGFQVNTAARLAEVFAHQRRDNLDLSGVAAIDPQLSLLPQIEANGFMRLAGFFPSIPRPVNFEMIFAPVDGQWRLFGLSVSLGESGPTPPSASNPAPAPAPPTVAAPRVPPTAPAKPAHPAAAAPAGPAR